MWNMLLLQRKLYAKWPSSSLCVEHIPLLSKTFQVRNDLKDSQHSATQTQFTLPFPLDFIEPPGIILGKMIAVFLGINWYRMKSNGKKKKAMCIHSEFKIKLFLLRPCLWPFLLVILMNFDLLAGLFGGTRSLLAGPLDGIGEWVI